LEISKRALKSISLKLAIPDLEESFKNKQISDKLLDNVIYWINNNFNNEFYCKEEAGIISLEIMLISVRKVSSETIERIRNQGVINLLTNLSTFQPFKEISEEIIQLIVNKINNKESINLTDVFTSNITYTLSHSESLSHTNQNSRIIIIHDIQEKKLTGGIKIIPPIYLGNIGQYIAGSKAAVGIVLDNICYICCHLPIDTSIKKEDNNYMGNSLRIRALRDILNKIISYDNVIISGDMNFRIYKENNIDNDQLKLLIDKSKIPNDKYKFLDKYNEFGNLDIKSCKINSESSCNILENKEIL
jgi:hypothetical protein